MNEVRDQNKSVEPAGESPLYVGDKIMEIEIPAAKKAEAIESIQRYMSEEIDVDVSEMQAGFILDYFTKELAPFAYNKGINDAQQFLLMKAEDLGGTCFEEGLTYWQGSNDRSRVVRRKPGD